MIINDYINTMMENPTWQSIDTAPKDRRILLYFPDLMQVTGRYDHQKNNFMADMFLPACYQPSHWQDLPSNPE